MKVAINGMFWDQPNTGSGQYVRELAGELVRLAPENDYLILGPHSRSRAPELLAARSRQSVEAATHPGTSAAVRRSRLARVRANLTKLRFEQVGFGRACRRERATLAHVPYFASPFFPPIPTVVTIHDLIPLILPLYRGSTWVRLYTRLVAASARRAAAVIADSECTRRDIVARLGIPASRVHVVYLAAAAHYRPVADRGAMDRTAVDRTAVERKYGLAEKYLLYLGGFDQRKNIRVIVDAFAQLRDLYAVGYRLVLAGAILGADSAFFPSPRRLAHAAGLPDDAVCYTGAVAEEDKPALYTGAALFMFPSLYEGFGLPPLEAMACGTPVLASNASSLPEIVGGAGALLDPEDPRAWAETIRAVVTEPGRRAEMRERGLAQAAKFSWARAARETLGIYADLS